MIYFFFLVLVKISFSQNIEYEKFQKFVQSPNGCVLDINVKHSYFDKTVVSSGVFYAKDKMYIYDSEEQYIKYDNQYITTINKIHKQVVYDLINESNVTIFDILSGNNHSIHFSRSFYEKDQVCIPFHIDLWGIQGSIWTSSVDGSPLKIKFIQEKDITVQIDINSSTISSNYNPPVYDVSDYEVISLID